MYIRSKTERFRVMLINKLQMYGILSIAINAVKRPLTTRRWFTDCLITVVFRSNAGYYMYTEATPVNENYTARLLSPVFFTNSSSNIRGCVQFWFHMYGRGIGALRVRVNGQVLWQRSGNQGNRWTPAAAPFFAKTSYQVRKVILDYCNCHLNNSNKTLKVQQSIAKIQSVVKQEKQVAIQYRNPGVLLLEMRHSWSNLLF